METETLIVGGGISGLHAALLLQGRDDPFLLLEARPRFGGRIRTEMRNDHPFELGPSWFWPETNPRLARLVNTFNLPHYGQHTAGEALLELPDGSIGRRLHREIDPRQARRLAGGTNSLVDLCVRRLPADRLLNSHRVTKFAKHHDHLEIDSDSPDGPVTIHAQRIILALPLRLLAATIEFTPALPPPLLDAFRSTPTWMAGDAKFFAIYEEPFWRSEGLSGSAYSEIGPLSECHDASLPGGPGALLGFLAPDPTERSRLGEKLIPACLHQLTRYFGSAAGSPQETLLRDWFLEPFTATAEDVPLLEHPAYGLPAGLHSLWDGRLRFAGTEAGPEHGGYLEGALEAAENAIG